MNNQPKFRFLPTLRLYPRGSCPSGALLSLSGLSEAESYPDFLEAGHRYRLFLEPGHLHLLEFVRLHPLEAGHPHLRGAYGPLFLLEAEALEEEEGWGIKVPPKCR